MDIQRYFSESFGFAPAVHSCAPGRVEVIGNHTDYNKGFVLSCAIDRSVRAYLGKSPDKLIRLLSTHFPRLVETDGAAPLVEQVWANYPAGVYRKFREAGFPVAPFCMALEGDIPLGAGLSSSAALEVATAVGLRALFDLSIDNVSLAKICQKAENEFVGAQCGLLDQFSSIFGRRNQFLYIDFRTLEHRTVALPRGDIALAIVTSGVTHSLAASGYNERRESCERAAAYFTNIDSAMRSLRDVSMDLLLAHENMPDPTAYKRALHVVGENRRVHTTIDALEKGDMQAFGRILYESHQSSQYNFENSCPELDALVAIARTTEGVYGARLTGGGFGGATLAVLERSAREAYHNAVTLAYPKHTGKKPEIHFASIAEGARGEIIATAQ